MGSAPPLLSWTALWLGYHDETPVLRRAEAFPPGLLHSGSGALAA